MNSLLENNSALSQEWTDFVRAQELGQIGWWRLDTVRNILTWSEQNYRIFGAPKDALLTYQTFLDSVHPEDRAYVDEQWKAALGGAPYDIEHRIVVDGQLKWVREKAHLEYDRSGRLIGGFGVTQDITDRKTVELALQRSLRRNELLSKMGARLLQAADTQGVVEELCTEVMQFVDCQTFFNFLVDEEAGRLRLNAFAGIPDEAAREIEWLDFGVAVCGTVARNGQRMTVERIQTQDDHRTHLVASHGVQAYCCHPLSSHGHVIGTLSFGSKTRVAFSDEDVEVMHAVSQLVSLAMARLKMEQELRKADQRKDEFLATLAHELRNPLAPIRTGVALLKRAGLDGIQMPRIHEMMERQVDHIVRLVDDLLEVSRIRSGKIALKREPVDVAAIVRDAAQTSQELFDANAVDLTVTTPDTPLMVHADPVRMTQVVANLLNNAAKYTEVGGRASIEARREGDEAVLTVADTGVGIPGDMLPHVFDLFAQVDRTLGRAQGGLGIGLALVRNLVRMHGGEVEAHSAGPGKGSCFILRLPLTNKQRVCCADAGAPLLLTPRARRILVVDDNRDAAESLAILLRALGASVQVAFDGEAGVVAAETFEPEIVFLDLGMPGVDGYETARRLRSTAAAASATIVALTGWGGEMVQEDVRKAGFDLHMVKPASTHDIERAFVFRS